MSAVISQPAASAQAAARASVYHLLARLWGREVDDALLQALRDGPLAEACREVGIALDDEIASLPEEEAVERLAVEYARLFLGPGPHVSANESMCAPGEGEQPRLWGAAASAVRRLIGSTGLSYAAEYTGLPDSVEVELELMGKLVEEEGRRRDGDDEAGVVAALALQRRFLEEHLGRCVGPLCREVVAAASLRFYASLATATEAWIAEEAELAAATGG